MRNLLKILSLRILGLVGAQRMHGGKLQPPSPWPDPPSTHDTIRDLRAQVHQLESQLNRCEAEKERLPRELTPEDCLYRELQKGDHQ